MRKNLLRSLMTLLFVLFVFCTPPATADREGWNEPGQAPEHNDTGLLHINTDYFNLAADTGGDFYYWAPGEFAEAAGLLNVPISSEPITLSYASSGGSFTHTLEVPVDGTLSQLNIFVGAQLLENFRLLLPDGRSIEENPTGVSVQAFRHMRIVTLTDPEPGGWMVELSGSGSFEVAVRYLTDRASLAERDLEEIELIDFAFVELRGRPGHQGLFTASEPLQVDAEKRCLTTLAGAIEPPTIELVSATGEFLNVVVLEDGGELSEDEYLGTCRIPDQPFRVQVRGKDSEGWLFQRVTSHLIRPAETSQ
jgi:hypothetical protein